jgi:hypothetical protein
MKPELIAACQMFLAPTTVLFAALGLAKTEGLKAGVSAVGLSIAVVWFIVVMWWPNLTGLERYATIALATLSGAIWVLSFLIHGLTSVGEKKRLPNFMQPDERP